MRPREATLVVGAFGTEEARVLEKPGDRIGRYRLLEPIGEGGSSVVYLAEQEEPVQRRVALKIIKLGMDTRGVVARFEAERQVLALMDHPNIAKVLDGGATPTGRPYFVMEWVQGVKITTFCRQERLPTRARLQVLIQVCHAIQHAHQKGIIHRDIKPSNVLVARQEEMVVPKVIDFGIAKAIEHRLPGQTVFTGTGHFIGTPAYTSPEQTGVGGLDIDTRTDVYSLGALLYKLLTGHSPFDPMELARVGVEEMCRIICLREPATPSRALRALPASELVQLAADQDTEPAKLLRHVAGDLDWIIMKCLEKDPARRYAAVSALAVDLGRFLHDEPVSAGPPGVVYRLKKLARRRQGLLVATAVAGVALGTGLALGVWQAHRQGLRLITTELVLDAPSTHLPSRAELAPVGVSQAEFRLALPSAARTWSFTPHDRQVASLSATGLSLWDFATLGQANVLPQLGTDTHRWLFSPDGRWLVTGDRAGCLTVWDWVARRQVTQYLAHAAAASPRGFILGGEVLVSSGADNVFKLWDTSSWKLRREWGLERGSRWSMVSVAGDVIAVANRAGLLQWRNAAAPEQVFRATSQPGLVAVGVAPNGFTLATASRKGVIELWSTRLGSPVGVLRGLPTDLRCLAFSPDSRWLAVAGHGRDALQLWEVASQRAVMAFSSLGATFESVAFSPNGGLIGARDQTGTLHVWHVSSPAAGQDEPEEGAAW